MSVARVLDHRKVMVSRNLKHFLHVASMASIVNNNDCARSSGNPFRYAFRGYVQSIGFDICEHRNGAVMQNGSICGEEG